MKLFLTGEIQIGKSTVIRKVLEKAGYDVLGFRTEKDRLGNGDVYLFPANGSLSDWIKGENRVAFHGDNGMIPLPAGFDRLGLRYLSPDAVPMNSKVLFLMDELGRFESVSYRFKDAVFEILRSDYPVLGVIREGFPGWTREVASFPGVEVIEVTKENRDLLPDRILNRL